MLTLFRYLVLAFLLSLAPNVSFSQDVPLAEEGDAAPLKIAVFTLHNTSDDPSLDWVGAGLQDALVTDLRHLRGLDAHTSEESELAGGEKGKCSLRSTAQKAQAAPLLAVVGAYARSPKGLAVELSICEKEKSQPKEVWKFEGPLESVLERASSTALSLAKALGNPATREQSDRVLSRKTRDVEAWRLFSEGYQLYKRAIYGTPDANTAPRSKKLFADAVSRDPDFAEAWNDLGWLHLASGESTATTAFERALKLKPDLANANIGMALATIKRDKLASIPYFVKGIALNDSQGYDATTEMLMFDAFAAQYKVKLLNLYKTRGGGGEEDEFSLDYIREKTGWSSRIPDLLIYDYSHGIFNSWLIKRGEISGVRHLSIGNDQVNKLVEQFRASIVSHDRVAQRAPQKRGVVRVSKTIQVPPDYEKANKDLSRLLFPREILAGLLDSRGIVIVPALSIGTVPFAALKPHLVDGDTGYLIDQMTITVAPSLGAVFSEWRWRDGVKKALVVGNPTVTTDPEFVFPGLPGAEKEARQVAHHYHVQPLIGNEATISKVRAALDKGGLDLLYFATHGVASEANGVDSSFLALSPGNQSNGRLTAREIQKKRNGAELVVLSACQTGLGQSHEAGIIGLARAFIIGGAKHVVMSLWNVSDEATSLLMQNFVKELDGAPPAKALRSAVLATRERYPKLSEWASFQLFGP